MTAAVEDARLAELSRICLVLPEAERQQSGKHASFMVRGWLALRLDRGAIDWDEVAALAAHSYRLAAPKRLAALVGARTG
jgi:hypothetical protein